MNEIEKHYLKKDIFPLSVNNNKNTSDECAGNCNYIKTRLVVSSRLRKEANLSFPKTPVVSEDCKARLRKINTRNKSSHYSFLFF